MKEIWEDGRTGGPRGKGEKSGRLKLALNLEVRNRMSTELDDITKSGVPHFVLVWGVCNEGAR